MVSLIYENKKEREGSDKCYYGSKTGNNIEDEGVRMINEALRINSTLTYLNLRSERMNKE